MTKTVEDIQDKEIHQAIHIQLDGEIPQKKHRQYIKHVPQYKIHTCTYNYIHNIQYHATLSQQVISQTTRNYNFAKKTLPPDAINTTLCENERPRSRKKNFLCVVTYDNSPMGDHSFPAGEQTWHASKY